MLSILYKKLTDLFHYFIALPSVAHDNVCDLKFTAKLNAFSVLICDQQCDVADIRIQGKLPSVA